MNVRTLDPVRILTVHGGPRDTGDLVLTYNIPSTYKDGPVV